MAKADSLVWYSGIKVLAAAVVDVLNYLTKRIQWCLVAVRLSIQANFDAKYS